MARDHIPQAAARPWWRIPSWIVLCGFLAIAGFFLITEHTAHVFGALPYLLLGSCLYMHLFMHHGHGGHEDSEKAAVDTTPHEPHQP